MSDRLARRIGFRIRTAREAAGLTPEQMATAIGVTRKQLEDFETAAKCPSANRLFTIAQLCDVSYFVDDGK
ncbi:MAG: helix-turn-helix domain-containing protein [Alphaproteobacteria bacterium]